MLVDRTQVFGDREKNQLRGRGNAMSKKRPPSKRWDVDPDYEPPVTRLKVRNDPSIVIPPAQNVSLPTHSRKRYALTRIQ